jgi:hypothetical protein
VKDDRIYGLFPEFTPWLDCRIVAQSVEKLRSFKQEDAHVITQSIPREWDMDNKTRKALDQFLTSRAAFLSSSIIGKLCPANASAGPTDGAEPNL